MLRFTIIIVPSHSSIQDGRGEQSLYQTTMQSTPLHLFALPLEIRVEIFSLAVSIDCSDKRIAALDLSRSTQTQPSHNELGLDLLLVCRQIYDEARLLPFQSSRFKFQRWYGSSTAECLKFLKRLVPMQTAALRHLALHITEADLGSLSHVDEICSCLLAEHATDAARPGLRVLDLHISRAGIWPDQAHFEDLFNLDRKWSIQGILRLDTLRELNITIANSVKLPEAKLREFDMQLRARMAWCSLINIVVDREKSPEVKFLEFSRRMGWGPAGPGTL